ncbi:Fis family transcriptional regulator [Sorangium cellulosum]|uniref:Fis family transcriptional regulator n=1 Tax=Sorangium cellulosum TaxID=56 RepID=A0A150SDA1_SORCE|nr:Fis family transcriptional regulator [Sorangium cellulosum]
MSQPTAKASSTMTLDLTGQVGDDHDVVRYLLVIDSASSRRLDLPRDGILAVGRSPEADIRIDARGVSRLHARVIVSNGEVQIADLNSHNGTLVNGDRLAGSRVLCSGDVVVVGDTILTLWREPHAVSLSAVELGRLRQRLGEELQRASDYARPLAVLVVSLGSIPGRTVVEARAAAALRLIDVFAWNGDAELVAVLPELGGEAARAAALDLFEALAPVASNVRGGLAAYPADGCDADTLVCAARAATAIAGAGAVALAAESAVEHCVGSSRIVVADPAMIRLFELIRRLAASDLSVLILGETGAGKENAAAALHHWSARARKPFVTLNCAAIPESLVESELFGYEKGAFSDARAPKPGLLERADGGTLFLDEVGELPLAVQAKLLRAIEARRFTRLGDVRERDVDFRIVAATNRDLEAESAACRFRQDLLFRLSAGVVRLPPLRHRPRELPILARLFLDQACARAGRPPLQLSDAALRALVAYPFPGNVRELKNAMEYASVTAETDAVEPRDLPERVTERTSALPPSSGAAAPPSAALPRFRPLAEEVKDLERQRIQEALDATGGVQTRAADLIGMPIRTFFSKLKQYGIASRRAKSQP